MGGRENYWKIVEFEKNWFLNRFIVGKYLFYGKFVMILFC